MKNRFLKNVVARMVSLFMGFDLRGNSYVNRLRGF